MPNFELLRANARERANRYDPNQEEQEQSGSDFTFAKIGAYAPSESEMQRLNQLGEAQENANKATFDSSVQF